VSTLPGVAPAIVKELDEELGRVKLNFPWLPGENKSYWARIATFMAGDGRGSWFMPEVGDEVLVAFEMGKVDHPYVVGFLWSDADKPPVKDDDIDGKVRRFRSVKKHRIDFDDRDGKERIFIKSSGEHALELADKPAPFIDLSTKGKRFLRLDDKEKKISLHTASDPVIDLEEQGSKITMKTGASDPAVTLDAQSITLKVGANTIIIDQSGVKIDASGTTTISVNGSLTISGSLVTIKSDGPLTLQGALVSVTASSIMSVTSAMASFTGVVQATGIISPTYTPGVGNLL
jgi:uncharacterized protein involved in type VI secretion and phage assembly